MLNPRQWVMMWWLTVMVSGGPLAQSIVLGNWKAAARFGFAFGFGLFMMWRNFKRIT